MDLNTLFQNSTAILAAVAWKVVGAIALWLVGRWLIGFALGLIGRGDHREQQDLLGHDPELFSENVQCSMFNVQCSMQVRPEH